MKALTIKDIIIEKINAVGADGLCGVYCLENGGGCGKDDLFSCCDIFGSCQLAKTVSTAQHCQREDCASCNISGCKGKIDMTIFVPFETEEGTE